MSRTNWTSEKLFHRLLNNKTERTRWHSVRELRKRPTQDVFDKCMELTYSGDLKARNIGIDVLAQFGSEPRPFYTESIKRFFEMLDTEEDPETIHSILIAISHNNKNLTTTQINKLCGFVDSDNELIKEGLVHAMHFLTDKKSIDTLIKLSSDKIGYVRDWAIFGLVHSKKNNKKIRDAMWARTEDEYYYARYEAIGGLIIKKAENAKDLLKLELLKGKHPSSLFDLIIEHGDKDLLPLLEQKYARACANEKTDAGWLEWFRCLKNCIEYLKRDIIN